MKIQQKKGILAVGPVLDPHYKMCDLCYHLEHNTDSEDDVKNHMGQVKVLFLALWNLYVPAPSTTPKPTNIHLQSTRKEKTINEGISAFHEHSTINASQPNALMAQLDLYLKERNFITVDSEDSKFNLLSCSGGNQMWLGSHPFLRSLKPSS